MGVRRTGTTRQLWGPASTRTGHQCSEGLRGQTSSRLPPARHQAEWRHTVIPGVLSVACTPLAAGRSKAGLLRLSLRLRLRCSLSPAPASTLCRCFVLQGSVSALLQLGKAAGVSSLQPDQRGKSLSSPQGKGTQGHLHPSAALGEG